MRHDRIHPSETPAPAPPPNRKGAPDKAPPRRPNPGPAGRLSLPFDPTRRRKDAGDWVYRHRVGLLVTVVLYLVAAILFLSYRIVIRENPSNTMYIDLVDPQELIPPDETPKPQDPDLLDPADYQQLQNRISNDNAKLDPSLKDDRRSNSRDIYDEAQRVQQQLAAGRQAYEQGTKELEAMANRRRTATSSEQNASETLPKNVKVQGNVTVRYNLEGRSHIYLHVPAYQCENQGEVMVSITVDPRGRVISASVDKASSTDDNCILEMAVKAAYASSFNVDPKAPEKQRGTISYIFVRQ